MLRIDIAGVLPTDRLGVYSDSSTHFDGPELDGGGAQTPALGVSVLRRRRPWPVLRGDHDDAGCQYASRCAFTCPSPRPDRHRGEDGEKALDLFADHATDQGDRRRPDPRGRGPALPQQRPRGAHQRLLRAGPLRQRLVLRRGHRRRSTATASVVSTEGSFHAGVDGASPASSCRRTRRSAAGSARSGTPAMPRTPSGSSSRSTRGDRAVGTFRARPPRPRRPPRSSPTSLDNKYYGRCPRAVRSTGRTDARRRPRGERDVARSRCARARSRQPRSLNHAAYAPEPAPTSSRRRASETAP